MTSERRRLALVALLALAGCGKGVHDLSVSADPLLVIRGHVDPASLHRSDPNAPLLALLVWASVPRIDQLCLAYPNVAELQAACPDPYGVYFGEIEKSVPVAADGSFEIDLSNLPAARVSVGDTVTRIAYGSLVIAEDSNGDGQLSLPRGGGGAPDGGGGTSFAAPDMVVAASFSSLRRAQERVVFREGGFVEGSNFYPAPGCPDPPPAFSVLDAPAYSDAGAVPGTCTTTGFGAPIEVPALTTDEAIALECRTVQQGIGVREATDNRNPFRTGRGPAPQTVCLSHELLAVITPGVCPTFSALALKGCRVDPFCTNPEWDDTAHPPSWWPCP